MTYSGTRGARHLAVTVTPLFTLDIPCVTQTAEKLFLSKRDFVDTGIFFSE